MLVVGDMNSVRHFQRSFVKNRMLSDKDETEERLSGVWKMMSSGIVEALHPEHPAAFGSSPK